MLNLYIVWQNEYNLGIPIIDEQHRAIVSTINTYHYFVSHGQGATALKPTFVTLEQYARTHFMTEENILEQTEFPEAASHKKIHVELAKKMNDMAVEAMQDKDFDGVLHFLREWWLNHIRIADVQYASHVKEKLETTG